MDSIISQFDKVYLEKLIAYNHILTQRNALLKLFSDTSSFNATGLEVWDDQLIIYGESIKKSRESFIQEFIPLFLKQYQFLSDSSEIVSLDYESSLHTKDFRTLLNSSRERDRILQYTTCGIHRDDLIFKLEDHPIKKFASQGQQKTFLIALKLAQFEIIRERKKISPILLLDDIYDKLDEKRFRKLIHLVGTEEYGQVFVTDSHPQRTEHFFNEIHTAFRIFHVNNTEISVQEHA
jgi:DNA replication and repair protein RecF